MLAHNVNNGHLGASSKYPRVIATVMIILALSVGCVGARPVITPVPPAATSASSATTPASPTPTPVPPTSLPTVATTPAITPSPLADLSLISQESLFAFLEDLTAIQPYSGWRNSATEGEAEALDYVTGKLGEFEYLQELGLEIERQSFHVFMTTELWNTRLHLTVGGQEVEVPADGIRGNRDNISQTLHFDSDGALNDAERNPLVVEGPVVLLRTAREIEEASEVGIEGKLAFVDYAAVAPPLLGKPRAGEILSQLVAKRPAGLVLVTRFSDEKGESHGAFVGDGSAFDFVEYVEGEPPLPTLYVRLEDLAPAGIESWEDLGQVEAARMTWDTDVFSPGTSGNVVARIPGADPSTAVILGAHIDSPNSPGALDDGSGSVVLLEVARVLNEARLQPPSDVYLIWFGSEELGLYGSSHFAATHQELLDRTLAMLQVDMLSYPLDGIEAYLNLIAWSYGRLGDSRLTWPDYLAQAAEGRGIELHPANNYGIESDNTAFAGFDVPNLNMIYMNRPEMDRLGFPIHYATHVHDPYDTVELAREVGDVLEQMAQVALVAALETGQDKPDLRVAPRPDRRAVFVASHTESVHMAPTAFTELGMALAWEGFDVDLIPYGQALTPVGLEGADLVVVLPVVDYPSPEGDPGLYDDAWGQAEIAALEAYVAGGGLLALTNSAYRLKYGNWVLDPNEDWSDMNALAERFGISYRGETLPAGSAAWTEGENPLVESITRLELAEGSGILFAVSEGSKGQTLAGVRGEPVVALVDYGEAGGQVLVLADVGILGTGREEPANLVFWQNLARYAKVR